MQWAINVKGRPMDSKRRWVLSRKKLSLGSADWRKGLQTKTWSEIGVRRFSGRRHNPCGGLHDSATEGWIIRAIMLGVPAIIRLVQIFNIHWDILSRHILKRLKGSLARITGHMPMKTYKHVRVCRQGLSCVYIYVFMLAKPIFDQSKLSQLLTLLIIRSIFSNLEWFLGILYFDIQTFQHCCLSFAKV